MPFFKKVKGKKTTKSCGIPFFNGLCCKYNHVTVVVKSEVLWLYCFISLLSRKREQTLCVLCEDRLLLGQFSARSKKTCSFNLTEQPMSSPFPRCSPLHDTAEGTTKKLS